MFEISSYSFASSFAPNEVWCAMHLWAIKCGNTYCRNFPYKPFSFDDTTAAPSVHKKYTFFFKLYFSNISVTILKYPSAFNFSISFTAKNYSLS